MSDWQPIATAPKDGSDILIANGNVWPAIMHVVYFDDEPEQKTHVWATADGLNYHQDYPTHWMPLPAPPNSGEGVKNG